MSSTWTEAEKEMLLAALKKHGADSITDICKEIPFKTRLDINAMIQRYHRIASSDDKQLFQGDSPMDRWLNVLRHNSSNSDLCPVARTFRYMKLFDTDIKNNTNKSNTQIDISECYELLEKLSKGDAPKELSMTVKQFIFETLKETAREVKMDKNTESTKVFLQNLKLTAPKEMKTYGKKRKVQELDGIQLINPLKLPNNLLTK